MRANQPLPGGNDQSKTGMEPPGCDKPNTARKPATGYKSRGKQSEALRETAGRDRIGEDDAKVVPKKIWGLCEQGRTYLQATAEVTTRGRTEAGSIPTGYGKLHSSPRPA